LFSTDATTCEKEVTSRQSNEEAKIQTSVRHMSCCAGIVTLKKSTQFQTNEGLLIQLRYASLEDASSIHDLITKHSSTPCSLDMIMELISCGPGVFWVGSCPTSDDYAAADDAIVCCVNVSSSSSSSSSPRLTCLAASTPSILTAFHSFLLTFPTSTSPCT
jgi:hypothetical protein